METENFCAILLHWTVKNKNLNSQINCLCDKSALVCVIDAQSLELPSPHWPVFQRQIKTAVLDVNRPSAVT